jgi:hypothetical protein
MITERSCQLSVVSSQLSAVGGQGAGRRETGVDDLLHREIVRTCKKSTAICLQKLQKDPSGRLWLETRTEKVLESTAVGVRKKAGITHGSSAKT